MNYTIIKYLDNAVGSQPRLRHPGDSHVLHRSGSVSRCSGRSCTGMCRSDKRILRIRSRPIRRSNHCHGRNGSDRVRICHRRRIGIRKRNIRDIGDGIIRHLRRLHRRNRFQSRKSSDVGYSVYSCTGIQPFRGISDIVPATRQSLHKVK